MKFTLELSGGSLDVLDDASKVRVLRELSGRYQTFIKRRFHAFSRGGGDWASLSPSTVRAKRRKGVRTQKRLEKKQGEQSAIAGQFARTNILIDTGILRAAIDSNVDFGIQGFEIQKSYAEATVGFSNKLHKSGGRAYRKGSPITIAQLAAFHHFGTDRLPAREILAEPDETTRSAMERILHEEISKE